MKKTAPQLADYYKAWLDKYPFVSIEDLAGLMIHERSEKKMKLSFQHISTNKSRHELLGNLRN